MNKVCVKCGNEIPKFSSSEKYCSPRCRKNFLKSEYKKRNREKVNAYNRSYRKTNPPLRNDGRKQLAKRFTGNKCVRCGSSGVVDIHHIIPLSHKGTHGLNNLLVLCHNCHAEWELRMKGYWNI